jgi:hypothetical protein
MDTPKCQRCGTQTLATTVSYFNTETLCLPCKEAERRHPDFPLAEAVEIAAVKLGNYNFEGIGYPGLHGRVNVQAVLRAYPFFTREMYEALLTEQRAAGRPAPVVSEDLDGLDVQAPDSWI